MASKKQFGLWGEEDELGTKPRLAGTNLSGARFSTRDFAVDQSVNLMAMGDAPVTNLSGSDQSAGFASSIAGLFRGTTINEQPRFDEYGDAAPSTESEEYISDKQRRMTPISASIRKLIGTKSFYVVICGALAVCLLVGGVIMATNKGGGSDGSDEVAMRDFIVQAGVTPETAFVSGNSSPQSKALKWIVHDDPANLKPQDKGVLDRYILAVFYFGRNKAVGWNDNTNWMTGKGTCSWAGIQCPPRSVTPSSDNNFKTTSQSYDDHESITGLILRSNNIEAIIPDEFGGLSELITLDLSGNNITGRIPPALGSMKKLRDLLLQQNSLVGTFPEELSQLTGLHQLHLGENKLEGQIPEIVDRMKNLRSLALSSNSFEGMFPHVEPLTLLLKLHLDDNQFNATVPSWLYGMTDLKDLRLSKNKFVGSIPSELKSLRHLEILHLDQNGFQGNFPDMFSHMPRLSDLRLQNNQFDGTIPSSIFNLQDLKYLLLDNNKFTGSIPGTIGTLIDVVTLSLHLNQLEGTIPSSIGNLDDIVTLTLNSNNFKGTIPTQIGECFRLELLSLDQNKLTGSIPMELGRLERLKELRLEMNSLVGVVVPSEVCELTKSEVLAHISADCKSKVTCACCHQCL